MTTKQLRELKRYYPALRSLRRDVAHNIIPMELYQGMGDKLIQMYVALHAKIKEIVDEPYVDVLSMDTQQNIPDEQKVVTVSLLAGQLAAYVESTIDYLEDALEQGVETKDEAEQMIKRFGNVMDEE